MPGLDPELRDWFIDTITIEPRIGTTQTGQPRYGPPVMYQARVEDKVQLVRDFRGVERATTHRIYVGEEGFVITGDDRLTIPDGTKPLIIAITKLDDDTGPYLTTIYT